MFIRVDYFIKIVESMIGQLKEMLRLPFFPHLLVNRIPSMPNISVLTEFESKPTAPSKVPAGQIYLQNAGSGRFSFRPYAIGITATNTARITYFRYEQIRVVRDLRIFGVGILCSSSWISPRGQSQPQIVRPRITP